MAKLARKKIAFALEYIKDFNASRAAETVGYSPRTAYSYGQKLTKDPEVLAIIKEHFDALAMEADEVIARLTDHARASVEDLMVFDGRTWKIDILTARERGKLHLIKCIKPGAHGMTIELHDAQQALNLLGRYHKLFVDRMELGGSLRVEGMTEMLDKIYGNG